MDFHQMVLESCGNRFLLAAANMLWTSNEQLRELWFQANDLTGVSSYAEHLRILRAIEARQPARAQQAMDLHFQVFIQALQEHLGGDGQLPA
jgi:DNA-binding FadR family transcriptional regulator